MVILNQPALEAALNAAGQSAKIWVRDELEAAIAAYLSALTPAEAGGLVERLENERPTSMIAVLSLHLEAATTIKSLSASLASERAAHAETKRALEAAIERENAAREFIKKHPSLTIIDISEFEAFLNLPEAFDRAAAIRAIGRKA